MDTLSLRQRRILAFIGRFEQMHHYAPALKDIGADVGLSSKSSVWAQLVTLRDEGLVTWVDGEIRTLALTDPAREWFKAWDDLIPEDIRARS